MAKPPKNFYEFIVSKLTRIVGKQDIKCPGE